MEAYHPLNELEEVFELKGSRSYFFHEEGERFQSGRVESEEVLLVVGRFLLEVRVNSKNNFVKADSKRKDVTLVVWDKVFDFQFLGGHVRNCSSSCGRFDVLLLHF